MPKMRKPYVAAMVLHYGDARVTVDSDGNADVELRYPPADAPERRAILAEWIGDMIDDEFIERATVGPPGGEDSVLVATQQLMARLTFPSIGWQE